ncbi:hypothetical protein [Pelomicrobium methylotrophicum]|uniref:hypothetical protein n=1 Tax=Pelomicrobium methylotrophicum TaxID=2602750 RepID=UPI001969F31F|nr:hypothetical protein [Pelomicrobium methylotrophicum]
MTAIITLCLNTTMTYISSRNVPEKTRTHPANQPKNVDRYEKRLLHDEPRRSGQEAESDPERVRNEKAPPSEPGQAVIQRKKHTSSHRSGASAPLEEIRQHPLPRIYP